MGIYKELSEYLQISEEEAATRFSKIDVNEEWSKSKNAYEFYKNTNHYLYDLTNFEHSQGKIEYWKEISRFIRKKDCRTGMDYGCGIGGDMIKMMQNGITECYGIDIPGKPMDYARWRRSQGAFAGPDKIYSSPIFLYISEKTNLPAVELARVDICICIAVLEHIKNAKEALSLIVDHCKYLVLKVDPTNPGGAYPMHFEENFEWLWGLESLKKETLDAFGLQRINETDPVIFSTRRGRNG